MKRPIPLLLAGLLLPAVYVFADEAPAPAAAPLEAYAAVGASLVHDNRLAQLGWTEAQVEAFLGGVRAGFRGEGPPVDAATQSLFAEINRRMQQLEQAERRQRFGAEAFARPGYLETYLKQMRSRFELQASDSGLCFGLKNTGNGPRPEPGDTVIVSYKVTAADTQTDVAGLGGERLRVKVTDLAPGLAEGVQMMSAGSVAMLILPPALSYGEGTWPAGTERGTPLIFTLALHEIIAAP